MILSELKTKCNDVTKKLNNTRYYLDKLENHLIEINNYNNSDLNFELDLLNEDIFEYENEDQKRLFLTGFWKSYYLDIIKKEIN